jgi:transposase-like protein
MSENVRPDENLSLEQRKAIEALASGATIDQAAVAADRTPATLRRWRREEDAYNEALQRAADEALGDAAVQLKGLLKLALERLKSVLEDDKIKTHHLLRAIDMTAGHVVKLTEFSELEERVAALEEQRRYEQSER